jgi:hypothetical protein
VLGTETPASHVIEMHQKLAPDKDMMDWLLKAFRCEISSGSRFGRSCSVAVAGSNHIETSDVTFEDALPYLGPT